MTPKASHESIFEMMSCPDLALRLTENYYSTNRFNQSSESLSGYLDQNGILLTICLGQPILPSIFGGLCSLGIFLNHVAASWIRNVDTGFRIFGGPPQPTDDELLIGLILDPLTADINCVYPIDAVTNSRLNNGCGPLKQSPEAPNQDSRKLDRYATIKFKNEMFAKTSKWSDVICEEFFRLDTGMVAMNNSDCSFAVEHDVPVPMLFESASKYNFEIFSTAAGHPVCNVTMPWPEPNSNTRDSILYVGSCVWKPTDWLSMLDTMVHVASDYPRANFWNEVVVAKRRALNDIVQAVFFVHGSHDQSQYEAAKKEALGIGKPLLILHPPSANSNLTFTCDESITANMLRSARTEE